MRFLVDECTGPAVAEWLRAQKHTVYSVYEEASGMNDDRIIHKAFTENWILITNDNDLMTSGQLSRLMSYDDYSKSIQRGCLTGLWSQQREMFGLLAREL